LAKTTAQAQDQRASRALRVWLEQPLRELLPWLAQPRQASRALLLLELRASRALQAWEQARLAQRMA
jgi:hypothetical protein